MNNNETNVANNTVVTIPKFMPGEVLDLSYKHGGLPNRIWVESVMRGVGDSEWNYSVKLENTLDVVKMTEGFISQRLINSKLSVYHCSDIIDRYNQGWRWCGNYEKSVAISNSNMLRSNLNIQHIRLFPALNPNGMPIKGYYGIWIKYEHSFVKNFTPSSDFIDIM